MRMNSDYLNSDYSSHYTLVKSAWGNTPKVIVVNEVFSKSKIDLVTPTQTYWDNRFGWFNAQFVLGICDITSTDGYLLDTISKASLSSKKIDYATAYYTPYKNVYSNDTHRRYTMVHEIGHALGLGHPNKQYYQTNDASVMRQDTIETYYTPRQHDTDDLNNKY